MFKLIEHRDNIVANDDYSESTTITLCDGS